MINLDILILKAIFRAIMITSKSFVDSWHIFMSTDIDYYVIRFVQLLQIQFAKLKLLMKYYYFI